MQCEPVDASSATRPFSITLVDPTSSAGHAIVRRFFADIVGQYWGREATDVEVEQAMLDEPSDDLRGGTGFLVIVRDGEGVVGCGGAKLVGKALVSEIETLSARRGVHTLRLTVREDLIEAHRLYR